MALILKILITFILLNLPNFLEARSLKFRGCTSKLNPRYFANFTIHIQNDTVSSEFDLLRPLIKDFKANIDFQIRLANSKNYQTLFGYTFDICSMMISLKDTIFKRLFKSVLKHSNFMQNCPVHEGHYYMREWRMESNLIPSYLHAGDYRFKGRVYVVRTLKNHTKIEDFALAVQLDTVIVDN